MSESSPSAALPAATEPPVIDEIGAVGGALDRLLADDSALPELEEALHTGDTRAFTAVLNQHQLGDRAAVICRWLCTWHVQRRCLWVCRDEQPTPIEPEELAKVAVAFAELAADRDVLTSLVETVDEGDGERFAAILERYGLHRYCRLICLLVLVVRCELFCRALSITVSRQRSRELVDVLADTAAAVGTLAKEQQLPTVIAAFGEGRYDDVHRTFERLGLGIWCRLVCLWLCVVIPYLHCVRVCHRFPLEPPERLPRSGDPGPIREWAKVTITLARRRDAAEAMIDAVESFDDQRLTELIREHDLTAWCHYVCFWLYRLVCYRRCLLLCPPRPPVPRFYRLGDYSFPHEVSSTSSQQVDTSPGGTGLTIGDGRAFFGTVRLNGSALQQTYAGGQAEYRFEVDTGTGWTPVPPHQIAPTRIGSWTAAGADPRDYVVNGTASSTVISVTPAPDGWIQVPPENSYWTSEGAFTSNGDFIRLQTEDVVPGVQHDVSTVDGGDAVPGAAMGSNRAIAIRMRWRRVDDPGDGLITGTAHVVMVNNDRWNGVAKGGSWLNQRVGNQLLPVSLDVDQIGPGCQDVDDALTVRYTAAHPQLGSVALSMSGPVPVTLTMTDDPASTAENRFGTATSTPAPADLPSCTYLATLSGTVLLTTGDSAPNPVHDQVAFKIQHP